MLLPQQAQSHHTVPARSKRDFRDVRSAYHVLRTWVEDVPQAIHLRPELGKAEALQMPVKGDDGANQRLCLLIVTLKALEMVTAA